ncbi:phosphomethylpyrimidine kinase type-1 [Anaerotruncus sp. CAG:390]|nr:phosphomethylpyrimidine kinase type-1 [Anaerotruncus sp. CAG:390]
MTDEKNRVPRAAALHDLSCFGRCALTVIDPVLSAMGIQCVPVPTALLSTHTGGFSDMYFCALDDAIRGIADHFEKLGLRFDAVYTGFLGSAEQAGVIGEFIDRFGSDDGRGGTPLVLVDPVLGDDGELYHTITPALTDAMRRLCIRADVITPNITEACLLSGMSYGDALAMSDSDPERLGRLLTSDLICLGGRLRRAVVTGIRCDGGKSIATASYDAADGSFALHKQERVGRDYPGTGDIFASVLLGRLLCGSPLADAAASASSFAARCAAATLARGSGEPARNGVALEPLLGSLSGGIPADKNL